MNSPLPIDPMCVKINDAARIIGVGRTKLYELIADNQLEIVKLGKSSRVTTASLRALVVRQSRAVPTSEER